MAVKSEQARAFYEADIKAEFAPVMNAMDWVTVLSVAWAQVPAKKGK